MWRVKYGWSVVTSIGLTAVIAGISGIPGCDNAMLLLLPGALLAAIIFTEGVHSSGAALYLISAGLLDILILSLLIFGAWSLIERRRQRTAGLRDSKV
jgi:high-affinity Fe2+/Pb2+ permease